MQEQTARQAIHRLIEQTDAVWDEVECLGLRERLSNLDTLVAELPIALGKVRERGYAYHKSLERRVQRLRTRWPEVNRVAGAEIERRAESLRPAMQRAEAAVRELTQYEDVPLDEVLSGILRAQDQLTRLREESEEARSRVGRVFAPLEGDAQVLEDEVRGCLRVLDARDSATFALEPDERLAEAVEAAWLRASDHEHSGVLFLTDRRLLYERREEVPGKRVFLIRRGPVRVQEVAWQAPVAELDVGEDGDVYRAALRRKDLLVLRFRWPNTPREVVLRPRADPAGWRENIARVHSGEIRQDLVT